MQSDRTVLTCILFLHADVRSSTPIQHSGKRNCITSNYFSVPARLGGLFSLRRLHSLHRLLGLHSPALFIVTQPTSSLPIYTLLIKHCTTLTGLGGSSRQV
uniref:Secreted protein n=1 Tax=Echinococcus granulosus TaxID=6210 RepID=A0A068X3B1_ECHGR|nr:hypothetical protein EgrG_002048700 [Echinococcus granulosus]